MNTKDYKAIAEIINDYFTWNRFGTDWFKTWKKDLALKMGDYFEQEDNKKPYGVNGRDFCKCGKQITRPMNSKEVIVESHKGLCFGFSSDFDREQFLKDCGVQ